VENALVALLICLGVVGVAFAVVWWRALAAGIGQPGGIVPTPYELLVGFVTDFFDALGIGSFATTTSFYRARKTIDDRLLPGTLNVGHTIPTLVQAYIYTQNIKVEVTTLITMIVAAVAGALLGASFVAKWPRRRIQLGMGCALIVICGFIVYRQLANTAGGEALGLTGGMLAIGLVANFVLGALMTIGIGLYAPCLVLVSLLGMNVSTAFPIMMGSCAFLMPLASIPFIRNGAYSPRAALGLTVAGVPAVLIAAFIVKELPLDTLKWVVAGVVLYTGIMLFRASQRG